jgi:hypothetical protein
MHEGEPGSDEFFYSHVYRLGSLGENVEECKSEYELAASLVEPLIVETTESCGDWLLNILRKHNGDVDATIAYVEKILDPIIDAFEVATPAEKKDLQKFFYTLNTHSLLGSLFPKPAAGIYDDDNPEPTTIPDAFDVEAAEAAETAAAEAAAAATAEREAAAAATQSRRDRAEAENVSRALALQRVHASAALTLGRVRQSLTACGRAACQCGHAPPSVARASALGDRIELVCAACDWLRAGLAPCTDERYVLDGPGVRLLDPNERLTNGHVTREALPPPIHVACVTPSCGRLRTLGEYDGHFSRGIPVYAVGCAYVVGKPTTTTCVCCHASDASPPLLQCAPAGLVSLTSTNTSAFMTRQLLAHLCKEHATLTAGVPIETAMRIIVSSLPNGVPPPAASAVAVLLRAAYTGASELTARSAHSGVTCTRCPTNADGKTTPGLVAAAC